LQGGSIQARSEEGMGSTFTVKIPYRTGAEADIEEKVSVPADPSKLLGNLSALVVDDEEYNRMLLETILARWGMTTALCDSGKKAIEELAKNKYDIVLMDVRMPGMDGIETTEQIRSGKAVNDARVPVLALTAAGSEQDIMKCRIAGMNDFLSKPFREAELFEKICAVLRIDFSKSAVLEAELMNNGENEKGYNLSELKRLGNGDQNFVHEMIKIFIQNTSDGMSAMKEAILKKDWEKAGLFAHRIAAPGRHLGMTKIVKKLKEIEINTLNKTNLELISSLFESLEPDLKEVLAELEKEVRG
jgi:CheY-like chemotaxis protein/HPt (histidine-containing phosphotransfer) domain-containing protein